MYGIVALAKLSRSGTEEARHHSWRALVLLLEEFDPGKESKSLSII
jgi:hypothetical protein